MAQRQTEQDLARLRDYLEQASFAQQERLPPERDLAACLGLTRNRLRTGLKKLAAEGLIWRHVGKGTFYGTRLWPAGIPFPINPLQDVTNPREVMQARQAIEPALARLAAFHATGRDLIEMGACLDKMATITDWNSWESLDCRLHRAIAQAAGNALLLVMFDTVQANRNKETWGRLREPIAPAAAIARATSEHVAIVRALRERNADAAEAEMRRHLRAVERSIFGES
jgi:DNA-binding FadR family transcriptional regulator